MTFDWALENIYILTALAIFTLCLYKRLKRRPESTDPVRRNVDTGTPGLTSPLMRDGRFENPWPTWPGHPRWIPYMKCFFDCPTSPPAALDELDRELPVLRPTGLDDPMSDGSIRLTWLGHATTLVQMPSTDSERRLLTILTDPIFSDRCFMVQFAGPKRFRPPPLKVAELPVIDVVLISHSHYDPVARSRGFEGVDERTGCHKRKGNDMVGRD